mmetsp:Transcript_34411/g.80578  ORF Transcript_34411/g.80578 Transcript_34411/m.80578 type:complete len:281 (+) Transcript_34411:10-852(+)
MADIEWRPRSASISVESALCALPEHEGILQPLRLPAVLSYDTAKHRFHEAVCAGLGLPQQSMQQLPGRTLADPLAALTDAPALSKQKRGANRGPSTYWIQQWKRRSPDARALLISVYVSFLRSVILPHMCAVCGEEAVAAGLLFQREPGFRCHVPGQERSGRLHCDGEYGHQRNECNFWLPLTRAFGSNTLWCESTPGAKDFAPFELDYGELQRFWGACCWHHTVPNTSGCSRVSLDFRVLLRSCYVEQAPRPDGTGRFEIGGFYHAMDANGELLDPDTL